VRIENAFEVAAAPDVAWSLLADVPRIVPCMPGASLERAVDEQTWEVVQHVKLGPISLQFRSEVRQAELSQAERRAVLVIKAKEVRGRGGADATVESRLEPTSAGTRVSLATELELRGAVAQYGRAVVGSVAEELTRQFAACLTAMLDAEPTVQMQPPEAAKPVGGVTLFLRALWAKLFRRG
jgi:carbon monoxide dehydrogenase subunit G